MSSSERFNETANEIRNIKKIESLVSIMKSPDKLDKKVDIEVDIIDNATNIRSEIVEDDDFFGLLESIKSIGLLQPLTVVPKDGKIVLLNGHRRYSAICKLGWKKVPVIIKNFSDEGSFTLAQLVENANRQGLKPMDHVEAISKIKTLSGKTNKQIGSLFGRHEKYINELVAISRWPVEAKLFCRESNFLITDLCKIAKTKDGKDPSKIMDILRKLKSDLEKNKATSKNKRASSNNEDEDKFVQLIGSRIISGRTSNYLRTIYKKLRSLDDNEKKAVKEIISLM